MILRLIFNLYILSCLIIVYVQGKDDNNEIQISIINSTTLKPIIDNQNNVEIVKTNETKIYNNETQSSIFSIIHSTSKPIIDLLSKNVEIVKTNIKESNENNDYIRYARQIKKIITGTRNIVEKIEDYLPRNKNEYNIISSKYASKVKGILKKIKLFCRIIESIIKRKIRDSSNQSRGRSFTDTSKGRLFTGALGNGLTRVVDNYNFYVPEVVLSRCLGRYVRGTYPHLSLNEYPKQILSDIYQYFINSLPMTFVKADSDHNLHKLITNNKFIKYIDVAENEIPLKEDYKLEEKLENLKNFVISPKFQAFKALSNVNPTESVENEISLKEDYEIEEKLENIKDPGISNDFEAINFKSSHENPTATEENEIPSKDDHNFVEKHENIKDSEISHNIQVIKKLSSEKPTAAAENKIPLNEYYKFVEKLKNIKDSVISHKLDAIKTLSYENMIPVETAPVETTTASAEASESWSRCLSFYGIEVFVRTLENFIL